MRHVAAEEGPKVVPIQVGEGRQTARGLVVGVGSHLILCQLREVFRVHWLAPLPGLAERELFFALFAQVFDGTRVHLKVLNQKNKNFYHLNVGILMYLILDG